MLKTLYGRLTLVLLAILVLVGGLFFFAGLVSVRNFLDEVHQKLNRELAAHSGGRFVTHGKRRDPS